jgi:hypothetical protein
MLPAAAALVRPLIMPVQNAEIAAMFDQAAELLEIQDGNQFRVRAYRRPACVGRGPAAKRPQLALCWTRPVGTPLGSGKDLAGEIADIVGLAFIPPELREDRGEIPLAKADQLPHLVSCMCIPTGPMARRWSPWPRLSGLLFEPVSERQHEGLAALLAHRATFIGAAASDRLLDSIQSGSGPIGFRFQLQLQDMPSHCIEPLFHDLAEKRILPIGQRRGDLPPVLWLQSLDRGREEITFLHCHVMPFVRDEVSDDVVYGLAQNFAIYQHTLDHASNPPQPFGTPLVLRREIADVCSRGGIACFQFLEYLVLLRMMVNIGIEFEIGDNGLDDLIVWSPSTLENGQLLLKDEEQLFDVPVLLAQKINNHRLDLLASNRIPPGTGGASSDVLNALRRSDNYTGEQAGSFCEKSSCPPII